MAPGVWSERDGVWTVGDPEESEVAVVCGVHGDEPCGKRAVERIVDERGDLDGATLVLANPRACERGRRYVDEDFNRAFPGDPASDAYERRLAARLSEILDDHLVLDLHSTASRPTPFALFQRRDDRIYDAVRDTGVDRAVDVGRIDGGLIGELDGVAVEVDGTDRRRGTAAAYEIAAGFLASYGLVDAEPRRSDPVVYRVPKRHDSFEIVPDNFERIGAGEVFARGGDEPVRTDESFHPVLVSEGGYDEIYGFRAVRAGRLSGRTGDGRGA